MPKYQKQSILQKHGKANFKMSYDIKEMDIFTAGGGGREGGNGSLAKAFPKKKITLLFKAVLNAFCSLGCTPLVCSEKGR